MHVWFRRFCGLLIICVGLSLGLSEHILPRFVSVNPLKLMQEITERHEQLGLGVLWQWLICLCLIMAVIGLQTDARAARSKTMRIGAGLILFGNLGLGIQAWIDTAISLMITQNSSNSDVHTLVWKLFPFFQKPISLIIPMLLLILLIGSTVYSAGFYHIDATGVWSKRCFLIGLTWLLAGRSLAPASAQIWVYHGFLFWITLAYVWLGFEICFRFRAPRPKAQAPPGREHLF